MKIRMLLVLALLTSGMAYSMNPTLGDMINAANSAKDGTQKGLWFDNFTNACAAGDFMCLHFILNGNYDATIATTYGFGDAANSDSKNLLSTTKIDKFNQIGYYIDSKVNLEIEKSKNPQDAGFTDAEKAVGNMKERLVNGLITPAKDPKNKCFGFLATFLPGSPISDLGALLPPAGTLAFLNSPNVNGMYNNGTERTIQQLCVIFNRIKNTTVIGYTPPSYLSFSENIANIFHLDTQKKDAPLTNKDFADRLADVLINGKGDVELIHVLSYLKGFNFYDAVYYRNYKPENPADPIADLIIESERSNPAPQQPGPPPIPTVGHEVPFGDDYFWYDHTDEQQEMLDAALRTRGDDWQEFVKHLTESDAFKHLTPEAQSRITEPGVPATDRFGDPVFAHSDMADLFDWRKNYWDYAQNQQEKKLVQAIALRVTYTAGDEESFGKAFVSDADYANFSKNAEYRLNGKRKNHKDEEVLAFNDMHELYVWRTKLDADALASNNPAPDRRQFEKISKKKEVGTGTKREFQESKRD